MDKEDKNNPVRSYKHSAIDIILLNMEFKIFT